MKRSDLGCCSSAATLPSTSASSASASASASATTLLRRIPRGGDVDDASSSSLPHPNNVLRG
eukprot:CAMPEP_0183720336 /NCGR_PEP_ID=MMETSP0737-20130205/12978_1 /TAXON_ID=385413 /ORGANISM="Thalassiosira miniscula, Strain CCMP1093" /LENGTH=61 /DNA_ID=CAMNT_0025950183 /DNA_START=34 /DNA_END=215 /DNA_ORIENTATION=+